MGQIVTYVGYVQCFCEEKFGEGDPPDQFYGQEPNQVQVCLEYYEQIWPTQFFIHGITVIIVTVNVLLKQITIRLVTWIGYDTHSEVM